MIQGAGSRPDFVFLLTDGLQMNMDVKFPFENYLKFLGEESEAERNRYKVAFLKDVRAGSRRLRLGSTSIRRGER